jgi:hypothetical protein
VFCQNEEQRAKETVLSYLKVTLRKTVLVERRNCMTPKYLNSSKKKRKKKNYW